MSSLHPRAAVLCLGPGKDTAAHQSALVRALGGAAIEATGHTTPDLVRTAKGIGGVIWWGDAETARAYEIALSERAGPILPLITGAPDIARVMGERHVCVDTTAAGGNAALLGAMA